MWSKLDDALFDHPKVFQAAAALNIRNAPAIALGTYVALLMWSNRHLTDGFIPASVVRTFRLVDAPAHVADALVKAGLLERGEGGFQIHDFDEYNPSARKLRMKRKADRIRKQQARNGHDS